MITNETIGTLGYLVFILGAGCFLFGTTQRWNKENKIREAKEAQAMAASSAAAQRANREPFFGNGPLTR